MNGSMIEEWISYKQSEPFAIIDAHFLEVATALLGWFLELSYCPIEKCAA